MELSLDFLVGVAARLLLATGIVFFFLLSPFTIALIFWLGLMLLLALGLTVSSQSTRGQGTARIILDRILKARLDNEDSILGLDNS